ncbi:MAG: addiction module toxin RelE, partial [Candidatus Sedimenticola sp. (ex Thyasira tokunagai)]
NRKHQRVGHVFQGRFKAILVEKEGYLLELARYIVLNPVRAGMVRSAEKWPWSSYRFTAGIEICPEWFDSNWLLSGFAKRRSTAIRRYMQFVADGVQQPSPWDFLRQQVFLGSDTFVDEVLEKAEGRDLSEVPRIQRRGKPKSLDEYAASAANRNEAMFLAYRSGGYTLKDISDYYGVHYSTVSRLVKYHAK